MKKAELIAAIAAEAGLTKKDAERALEAFLNTVKSEVKAGNKVSLIGFGNFATATIFNSSSYKPGA